MVRPQQTNKDKYKSPGIGQIPPELIFEVGGFDPGDWIDLTEDRDQWRACVRRVTSNILNKQSWTAFSDGPPAWGLVEGITTPHHKKRNYYESFR